VPFLVRCACYSEGAHVRAKTKRKREEEVPYLFHVVIATRFKRFVMPQFVFGAQPRANVFAPVAVMTNAHTHIMPRRERRQEMRRHAAVTKCELKKKRR